MLFRQLRTSRLAMPLAALLALALVATACGNDDDDGSGESEAKGSLTIGAFNFTESAVLSEIYAGALREDGYTVTIRPNLGSREVVSPALERGELDLYIGYAATDLEHYNNNAGEATPDARATADKLRSRLGSRGLTALEPSPAVDQNAFAVTKATADRLRLRRLSDLAPVAGQLSLGGPPECPTRPFCAAGLESKYGIRFREFKAVGLGAVANNALERGDVDVTLVLSTDGGARARGFVLLEDDRQLQNADNIIPVMRAPAATDEVRTILNRVSAALTTEELAELNRRVDDDKEDADVVAREWLSENGFGD
ncbi:MAG TPA: ABC transporter substrate-binding protein [Acidimicrobiales bacterium]